MDVTELHDEENLLVQMQDRWENYGSLDAIVDTHDPFTLEGAPRFELSEKIDSLLSAQQVGTTQKAVQKKLVSIVEKLRHHDDSIELWKYLNR